jgi:ferredoxin
VASTEYQIKNGIDWMTNFQPARLERENFQQLLEALKKHGYTLAGPTVQDGAIVYDEIESVDDLPEGWGDEQGPGYYRLRDRGDKALFGYNSGPHAWKKFLYPAAEKLWNVDKDNDAISFKKEEQEVPSYALVGVHSCDLAAIKIHDKVFMQPDTADPRYGRRRANAFIVVSNCTQCSGTCFCDSMGTGPKAEDGFDLAMTEIISGGEHYFVIEAGSDRGSEVLEELDTSPAGEEDVKAAADAADNARLQQTRSINNEGIKELFYNNYENPHWEKVAERCMSCANCTMVCPTCFCARSEDHLSLGGDKSERWRYWDSCFSLDFSYIHGGTVRQSASSRYRQWITHKLASWIDQFGTSGCVGCGRCITWCPVGIDITEETAALRESKGKKDNE